MILDSNLLIINIQFDKLIDILKMINIFDPHNFN